MPADRRKKKKSKVDKELAGFIVPDPVKEEPRKKNEEMDYEEFRAALQKGPLFGVKWHRIILGTSCFSNC